MSKPIRLSSLLFALALGGCQTVGQESTDVFPTALPSQESVYAVSGDPNRLGRSHLAAGNYALAQRQFQDAVEKNKRDTDSWLGLAAAYDQLGRFDLADRAYRQTVALGGETLEVANNRGYSYLLRGDGARAQAQFRRALALDPGNPVILNNIRLLQLGDRHVRGTPL